MSEIVTEVEQWNKEVAEAIALADAQIEHANRVVRDVHEADFDAAHEAAGWSTDKTALEPHLELAAAKQRIAELEALVVDIHDELERLKEGIKL